MCMLTAITAFSCPPRATADCSDIESRKLVMALHNYYGLCACVIDHFSHFRNFKVTAIYEIWLDLRPYIIATFYECSEHK